MATFRQIQISFWQDSFVLDLTPEEKYFYIYLLTNSKTTQCGLYELPKKIIEIETGYNRETIDKLLKRFEDYKKIVYDESTKEILLLNWIKYNASKSPKVVSCINEEIKNAKSKSLLKIFYTLCIQYRYPINSLCIDSGEEEEEEEEKEEEKEEYIEKEEEVKKEIVSPAATTNVFKIYEENISPIMKPLLVDEINSFVKDMGEELVIKSIYRAVAMNKISWAYCKRILNDWISKGIKTVEQADNEQKIWQNKNSKPQQQPKKSKFNNFPQTEYNWKEIEELDTQKQIDNSKNVAEEINILLEQRKRNGGAANA